LRISKILISLPLNENSKRRWGEEATSPSDTLLVSQAVENQVY